MQNIPRYLIRGFLALLPISLSVYVVVWFLRFMEGLANDVIGWLMPDFVQFPGLGTLLALLLIGTFGYFLSHQMVQYFYREIEKPIQKVPVISTIYNSVKDLTAYLAPEKDGQKREQVVLIRWPGTEIELVGFITRTDLNALPDPITKEDRVAVYFPMSYQVGGYTLFVPKSWLQPVNMDMQNAMRSILTAWVGKEKNTEVI